MFSYHLILLHRLSLIILLPLLVPTFSSQNVIDLRDEISNLETPKNVDEYLPVLERIGDIGSKITTVKDANLVHGALSNLAATYRYELSQSKSTGGLPDKSKIIQSMKDKFSDSNGFIDWRKFGIAVSMYWHLPPTCAYVLGPMTEQPPERKRKAPEAGESSQPVVKLTKKQKEAQLNGAGPTESLQALSKQDLKEEEARTASRANWIQDRLFELQRGGLFRKVKCSDGDERQLLPLIPVLFDPFSYSQTVENLFYFSFKVKQGFSGIYLGEDGEAYICAFNSDQVKAHLERNRAPDSDDPESNETSVSHDRQFGFHIDLDSYHVICKKYSLSEPLLGHRKSQDSTAPHGYQFVK
jgi:non-structural maintenance of chromosomes element 4